MGPCLKIYKQDMEGQERGLAVHLILLGVQVDLPGKILP